jgi:hypothetical protein
LTGCEVRDRLFLHRVHPRRRLVQGQDALVVLDADGLKPGPMQFLHVVEFGVHGSQLLHRLHLHDALRLCRGVGIGDGEDVDTAIEGVLSAVELTLLVPLVMLVHIVGDDLGDHRELTPERGMQTRMHRRHHLHRPLQQRQRGADRRAHRLGCDLGVGNRSDTTRLLNQGLQQPGKDSTRLLVRHREDVLGNRSRRNIDIAPLAGGNRGVVALGPEASGLQPAGQVGQGAGVDQLPEDRGGGLGDQPIRWIRPMP